MRLSASSIKTFVASKAKRAGMYPLNIKDNPFAEDSMALGALFEDYLMTGKDNYQMLEGRAIEDMPKLLEWYDNLKHNATGLSFTKGIYQYKAEGLLFGYMCVGYIDNFVENCIDDIKTCQYLTKQDSTQKNMRSGMTTYEEYELQLWVYMKLTGVKKSRIIEVAKHRYKEADRYEHQILDFELTDEFDKKMMDKYEPIVKEMAVLYAQFKRDG